MNFDLTEKQQAFHDSFRAFCADAIAPGAALLDAGTPEQKDERLRANLAALAGQGYPGLVPPGEAGGEGRDRLCQVLAHMELSKACGSTFLSAHASGARCAGLIAQFGREALQEEFVGPIAEGRAVGAYALTEPEPAPDGLGVATAAEPIVGGDRLGGYRLTGAKQYVTNGPIANVVVAVAVTDAGAPPEARYSLFALKTGGQGITAGPAIETMGFRGAPIGDLELAGCEVTSDAVLGEVGRGYEYANALSQAVGLDLAAASVGLAEAALEASLAYASERQSGGKPIIAFQEVSFRIAEMRMFLDAAKLLVKRTAGLQEAGDREAGILTACTKVFASEAATQIANWAVQIHGGAGLVQGAVVERLYREAKFGELLGTTTERLRLSIAQEVLETYSA